MVAISMHIEAQEGLTWPAWQRFVHDAEAVGFAGLYRSDHFLTFRPPPERDSLDLIVSLSYVAEHSRRLQFGPLVAPLSLRDPRVLAREAVALDDLSGGRMVLGLGTGWQGREHEMFGYELGDTSTRLGRLEEGLEVITSLIRSEEPITFSGRFYQLRNALLLPRPARRGGPPILIGGNGPRRTLPLVARYADIWNASWLSPEDFHNRSTRLDALLRTQGRRPEEVRRTIMLQVYCARTPAELEQRLSGGRAFRGGAGLSAEELATMFRSRFQAIIGPPEHVIERISAYGAAGVEEVMVQWPFLEDLEGLTAIADHILPHFR
jgi:F420-dependent oxidoreductase-like protein